ncbi:MAG: hypothetical protein SVG88_03370 [Halobacteriales archaeon]|nr:hypothetical protein [Halobacteriales archaeon]
MAEADTEPDAGAYRVSIKRSARRCNAQAAEWVANRGPVRRFESKATASEWAKAITENSDDAVRIQDAVPHDHADVDGYLVADPVSRRRTTGGTEPDDTAVRSLAAFGDDEPDELKLDHYQTQF